jgi:hypothetical protein
MDKKKRFVVPSKYLQTIQSHSKRRKKRDRKKSKKRIERKREIAVKIIEIKDITRKDCDYLAGN